MTHVFISHASEDKDDLARPLAGALRSRGVQVWFDEYTLKLGDNLRKSIDSGLRSADYGVVILSPAFFSKEWPQRELDALWAREASDGRKLILPILHHMTISDVLQRNPMLAGKIAASSSKGIEYLVTQIIDAIEEQPAREAMLRDGRAHVRAAPSATTHPSGEPVRTQHAMANGCLSFGRVYVIAMTGAMFFAVTAAFMLTLVDSATFWKIVEFNTHLRSSWLGETIIGLFAMVLALLVTIAAVRQVLKRYGFFPSLYAVATCCCAGYLILGKASLMLIPENPWAQHLDIVVRSALSGFLTVVGLVAVFHLIVFWASLSPRPPANSR